jgi:hypothetical protein
MMRKTSKINESKILFFENKIGQPFARLRVKERRYE